MRRGKRDLRPYHLKDRDRCIAVWLFIAVVVSLYVYYGGK